MRLVWRLLAILGVFVAVGYGTMRALIAHAVAKGTPEYDVRLGGAMGGLFVGGVAAVMLALLLFLGRKRPAETPADKGGD